MTSSQREGAGLPLGVVIRTIGTDPVSWLEGARRLDEAGYAGVWAWDHLMGRPPDRPTVEAWTILAMAAASTSRATVGTFVVNVMNRHPALLARMASTLQIASGGRFILGLGIGAATGEHTALGIDLPDAPERAKRLEEAVAVIRAIWTGEPVSRESAYYPLHDAVALPAPDPPPRIVIAGETPAGARRAARIGDGWTASDSNLEALLPVYLEALDAAGRRREDQVVLIEANEGDYLGDTSLERSPWITAPRATWARWHDAGSDGAVILARSRADIDALVDAAERW